MICVLMAGGEGVGGGGGTRPEPQPVSRCIHPDTTIIRGGGRGGGGGYEIHININREPAHWDDMNY